MTSVRQHHSTLFTNLSFERRHEQFCCCQNVLWLHETWNMERGCCHPCKGCGAPGNLHLDILRHVTEAGGHFPLVGNSCCYKQSVVRHLGSAIYSLSVRCVCVLDGVCVVWWWWWWWCVCWGGAFVSVSFLPYIRFDPMQDYGGCQQETACRTDF